MLSLLMQDNLLVGVKWQAAQCQVQYDQRKSLIHKCWEATFPLMSFLFFFVFLYILMCVSVSKGRMKKCLFPYSNLMTHVPVLWSLTISDCLNNFHSLFPYLGSHKEARASHAYTPFSKQQDRGRTWICSWRVKSVNHVCRLNTHAHTNTRV